MPEKEYNMIDIYLKRVCNMNFLHCEGMVYIIKQGDTLYSISRRYSIPLAMILQANPYADMYNLQVGDEICIPVMSITPRENSNMNSNMGTGMPTLRNGNTNVRNEGTAGTLNNRMNGSMSPNMNSGMNAGMSPDTGSGISPGMAPGISPGMSPSISPGMSPGMSPSISPGTSPDMGSGVNSGMNTNTGMNRNMNSGMNRNETMNTNGSVNRNTNSRMDNVDMMAYVINDIESIEDLMERFNMTLEELLNYNNLNSIILKPGTTIYVPVNNNNM